MSKKKITMPFNWHFTLAGIVAVQFQLDLSRLNSDDGDISEFPVFMIDLKTGELLMVDDIISSGEAYQYDGATNWLVEGLGWWIGYSDSDCEYKINIPDESMKAGLLNLFENRGLGGFNALVSEVCELGRKEDLSSLSRVTGLYAKLINNDDAPGLG